MRRDENGSVWNAREHPRDPRGQFTPKTDGHRSVSLGLSTGQLSDDELFSVMDAFGVNEDQVRRDFVISHCLAAMSVSSVRDDLVFFGGTAFTRAFHPTLRLSEDLDLIAMSNTSVTARRIDSTLQEALEMPFGSVVLKAPSGSARNDDYTTLVVGDVEVRIQLLSKRGYPDWPTEYRDLEQRYTNVGPARMRVLTAPAFAAAKLSAWSSRAMSRDLYDLWSMAEIGMIDHEASRLFSRFGTFTNALEVRFDKLPSDDEWKNDLGGQCRIAVDPRDAAATVSQAWREAS